MNSYFIVFGSSNATCRGLLSGGKAFAYGFSEPFLPQAGLSMPRTVAASQMRPCLSNMELWLLARVSHNTAPPQYGESALGFTAAAGLAPSDTGISGSRTGILKHETLYVFGSRMGMLSVEYCGEPNNGPEAFTLRERRLC